MDLLEGFLESILYEVVMSLLVELRVLIGKFFRGFGLGFEGVMIIIIGLL